MDNPYLTVSAVTAGIWMALKARKRLQLSRAKHPSLQGHSKMSRAVAKIIPYLEYDENRFFQCDDAPQDIAESRKRSFHTLAQSLRQKSPLSIEASERLEDSISDVMFTNHYRVPFPFRKLVRETLKLGTMVTVSHGNQLEDMDGNLSYDLSGSYGVNIFGYEFYKDCLKEGYEQAGNIGPVLGPYPPLHRG